MPTAPKKFTPHGAPVKSERLYDKEREKRQPWRAWYRTARWKKARVAFLNANPRCVDCNKLFPIEKLHVDHEAPHCGDYGLFWNPGNWRSRCEGCHGKKTRRGE